MYKFLCFSFAESAFLAIDETNFFQEVVCWYSSMKKFKIESYKFCALCTLKSHLVNLFPVELLFCCESDVFLPLLLTLVGWFTFVKCQVLLEAKHLLHKLPSICNWNRSLILKKCLNLFDQFQVVERILYIYAKLNPGIGYVQVRDCCCH